MIVCNAKYRVSCLAALLFVAHLPTAAAQEAGAVIFARGAVSAERQPPEVLAKGDAVNVSDTVVTGDTSRAQLLMIDGAKIALRPNSRLAIAEYASTAPVSSAPAVTSTEDSAVLDLVKGGFRTITGAIGKDDEADYEVRTAVGVLGIRGTDYSAVFCRGDCDWVPGVTPGAPIPDGLYLGVNDGAIVFRTATRSIELTTGEYAFIPLDEPEPQRLDAPPAVLLDDNDLRFDPSKDPAASNRPNDDGSNNDGSDMTGFNSAIGTRRAPTSVSMQGESTEPDDDGSSAEPPRQPTIATDPDGSLIDITPGTQPDPAGNRNMSFSTGPLGAADSTWAATFDNEPSQFSLDFDNNVTGFAGPYPVQRQIPGISDFDINTASNIDTGFDSMTVLRWGRWSGGSAEITLSDGSTVTQDLTNQSLHWVSGPENGTPTMPITGSASYTLVGATSPTDNLGNVGTLGSASFDADFTNLRVDSTLNIDINGSNWLATGVGNIGSAAGLPAHLFQGLYGAVVIDGVSGGTGIFSGFFSQPGMVSDPSYPGGVGLTFSLQDGQGTTSISGAAVFGNP